MQFTPRIGLGLLACALSWAAVPVAPAAPQSSTKPFFQVDFGTNSSPVQPGFAAARTGVGHVEGPLVYEFEGYKTDAIASGSITLTVAGGSSLASTEKLCARDREEGLSKGELKLGDLYRDFITGPSAITVGISGLKPGAVYQVQVYSFDKNRSLPMEIADYSQGKRGETVSITPDAKPSPAQTAADARTASLPIKTSASGQIVFRITSTLGGSAVLNALTLSPK